MAATGHARNIESHEDGELSYSCTCRTIYVGRADEPMNAYLAILARGVSCPSCHATPDEPCMTRTLRRPAKNLHAPRIDRAVRLYQKGQS